MNVDAEKFEQLCQELGKYQAVESVTMSDVLELPDPIPAALRRLVRGGTMTLSEFAEVMELDAEQAQKLAILLIEKGFFKVTEPRTPARPDQGEGEEGEACYQLQITHRQTRRMPSSIWSALDDL